jgi:hypothetical protein
MSFEDLGTLNRFGTPGTLYNRDLTPSDPTDIYRFEITSTKNINLSLHDISSGDDADLYLYRDSNGNGVLDGADTFVDSSVQGSNKDDAITVQGEAGTYFAEVSRYDSGSSGDVEYTLNFSATELYPSATTAPNLLPNEFDGDILSWGETYTNNDWVGNTDTSDVYRFSLEDYSDVTVTLTGLSDDADIRIVQDFNSNQCVDVGLPYEVSFFSRNGSTSDESISFELHGGNSFYVQVYQYSGDTSYQLQVEASSWI